MVILSLTKRERHILIVAIVFITGSVLYNFVFEPGMKKWQLLESEIRAKRLKIKRYQSLLDRKDLIIKEYNTYAGNAKNISSALSYLEKQADSFGIRTANIKPGQAIDKGLYRECDIELQIEGGIEAIIKFLSEILKAPNPAILKKFHFNLVSQDQLIFKGTIVLSKLLL